MENIIRLEDPLPLYYINRELYAYKTEEFYIAFTLDNNVIYPVGLCFFGNKLNYYVNFPSRVKINNNVYNIIYDKRCFVFSVLDNWKYPHSKYKSDQQIDKIYLKNKIIIRKNNNKWKIL